MADVTPHQNEDLAAQQAELERMRADLEARESAVAAREAQQAPPSNQTNSAPTTDEQLLATYFDDPIGTIRRIQQESEARVYNNLAPVIRSVHQQNVVGGLGNGLGQGGQEFLRDIAGELNVADIDSLNPKLKSLITRAARDADREYREKNPEADKSPLPTPESAYGRNSSTLSEDERRIFGDALKMFGEEEVTRLKKEAGFGDITDVEGIPQD